MYKDNKNSGKYQHKNSQNGDHSTKGKISHAPYNFIPFCDKILEAEGEIPGHDTIDPALKNGRDPYHHDSGYARICFGWKEKS